MQKIFLSLLLGLGLIASLQAQNKGASLSVYFKSDKANLEASQQHNIDTFIDSIGVDQLVRIGLIGNTDSKKDSLYNFNLSQSRVETVPGFLENMGISQSIISVQYFGEEKPVATNETEKGRSENRRVDIKIVYKIAVKKDTIIPEPIVVPIDTCANRDTTIWLNELVYVVFNRCEYLKKEDCLDIQVANTSADVLGSGLTLMDESGAALASCGMIKIYPKDSSATGGCSDCFDYPLKVYMKAPDNADCDFCGRNARMYRILESGNWEAQDRRKDRDIRVVTIDNIKYYQFTLTCPNSWVNCDCPIAGTLVKIKIPRKYKIRQLKIYSDCPVTVTEALLSKHSNRKASTRLWCGIPNYMISGEIEDADGNVFILAPQPLNDLKKRVLFSSCPKIRNGGYEKKILGIWKLKKRAIYRKYIIREGDFRKNEMAL